LLSWHLMQLAWLEMLVSKMDEHGHWKFKHALVKLFICGCCKSIWGWLICDHGVVCKGCYDMLIYMATWQISRTLWLEFKSNRLSPLALHFQSSISWLATNLWLRMCMWYMCVGNLGCTNSIQRVRSELEICNLVITTPNFANFPSLCKHKGPIQTCTSLHWV
jgi:hypothetical protein